MDVLLSLVQCVYNMPATVLQNVLCFKEGAAISVPFNLFQWEAQLPSNPTDTITDDPTGNRSRYNYR